MRLLAPALLLVAGCAASDPQGVAPAFDLDADWSQPDRFFAFPYPSDLRLTAEGAPDVAGWPDARPNVIQPLVRAAMQRKGFPTIPVAYFAFPSAIGRRDPGETIPARPTSPLLLVDVDPTSPERGRLLPVVAHTPPSDSYVPDHLLAVAPRPGFVLVPGRRYAFVVLRSLGDAGGRALGVARSLATLRDGGTPTGARGAAARDLYAPFWPALATAGVDAKQVAAATVFTPGDVVADLAALGTALAAKHRAVIHDLAPGATRSDRFCHVVGKIRQPQFQRGAPPFNSEGLFDLSDGGLPAKQRDEEIPIALTLPKTPMPAAGYPLLIYFHGSGGASNDAIDAGRASVKDGPGEPGRGPAYYHSAIGLGTACTAMPISPERVPGASDYAYLNFGNLIMVRDLFRQGVIEQRLFLDALARLEIDRAALGACAGPKLPQGAARFKFDLARLVAQGQSMGGMYVNLVAAVEPRIQAAVPTGAGGYWSWFLLNTRLTSGLPKLLALYVGASPEELSFLHPALHLVETAIETSDPFVFMPRLARRPLPGHPARPIYQPVGRDDVYFARAIFDAVALSYGHQQAGDEAWPSMQDALALDGLAGMVPYPVRQNRAAADGRKYTGAVVQYPPDEVEDAHYVYRQRDEVKYQYGCFLSTFLESGVAVIPATAALGTPCPR